MIEAATFAGAGPAESEGNRCSLIGNGFHIPSIMIALILLSSLQGFDAVEMPTQHPMSELWETRLRNAVSNTVFQPGYCEAYPRVYTAVDMVNKLWDLLQASREFVDITRSVFSAQSVGDNIVDPWYMFCYTRLVFGMSYVERDFSSNYAGPVP